MPAQARPQLRAHAHGSNGGEERHEPSCPLYGAPQSEEHPQAGVGAAKPTSTSTADGFAAETRPRGRRIPTQILCHTKSHGRSIRRCRTLPALPGGSRQRGRYPGTWRWLASSYTSVCALRSLLERSRTPRPLWLRALVGTEVSRCNALPRVSLYLSAVVLGTGAPRIVVLFPACA